jgi:hypothetical protein
MILKFPINLNTEEITIENMLIKEDNNIIWRFLFNKIIKFD